MDAQFTSSCGWMMNHSLIFDGPTLLHYEGPVPLELDFKVFA